MKPPTIAALVAVAGVAVVAVVLALPGPGDSTTPVADPTSTLSPPRAAGPTPGAATKAEVAAPQPATGAPDTGGAGALHMLDSVELGSLGQDWTWTTLGTTAGEGTSPGASCEGLTLAALGAFDIARRDFGGPGEESRATAGQVIGSFTSPSAARQAYAAMQSWRQTCPARMQRQGYDSATVGPFVPLRTKAASAGWWSARMVQDPRHPDVVWTAQTAVATSRNAVEIIWIETGEPGPAARSSAAITATLRQSSELIRSSVR